MCVYYPSRMDYLLWDARSIKKRVVGGASGKLITDDIVMESVVLKKNYIPVVGHWTGLFIS